jgi:RNA polymerase sigma-70 factor (ECF subfamily)
LGSDRWRLLAPLGIDVVTLARPEPEISAAALRSPERARRERAWRSLYEAQFDALYRFVCRFGIPLAEVEDVTQAVFVRAHRRLVEAEEVRDLRAWLRGIAVRVVAEHLRWRRVRRVKEWLLRSTADAASVPPPTPEREVSAHQAQALCAEILAGMSVKLRSVLVLLEIEQCTLEETATILGLPINTVRSRKRLAREQFQRAWASRTGRPTHER